MIAKPVVKNKFWIVEDQGRKVATIQKNEQGISWVTEQTRQYFPSLDLLRNHYNIKFDKPVNKKSIASGNTAYGYPTEHQPHNIVWDLRHQIPLYTRDRRSKCYYAAGWYVFDREVVFCPKVIYINRNSFSGPYMTQQEAVNEQNIIKSRVTKVL